MAKRIPAPKVDAAYGAMLIDVARSRMKDVELGRLAGIGVSKQGDQNIQRLRTGKGSVLLAYRVRDALVRSGANVPPIVLGADGDQARWIRAGEALRELAPAEFETELKAHEDRVDVLKTRAAERGTQVKDLEGSRVFEAWNKREPDPLRRDRAAEDRGAGYVPKNGPQDKGTVGRTRKSPRSDGR